MKCGALHRASGAGPQQPWFAARRARLPAEAGLVTGVAGRRVVEFHLEGGTWRPAAWRLSAASVTGRFAWPRVEITAGTIATAAGEKVHRARRGGILRRRKSSTPRPTGRSAAPRWARWLPAQPDFDTISIQAQARGPLASLTHTGQRRELRGVKWRGLNPLALAVTVAGDAGMRSTKFTAGGNGGHDDDLRHGRGRIPQRCV